MADGFVLERDLSNEFAPDPYASGTGFMDYAKSLGLGALDIGAGVGAAGRYVGENNDNAATDFIGALGAYTQELFNQGGDAVESSMSPAAIARMNADITDPEFWSLATLGLKGSRMVPSIAAAAIPAGVFSGVVAGTMAVGATAGALSATDLTNNFYEMTDELTDAELQEESQLYREMRADGVDEAEARQELNGILIGYKPAIALALGAATGTFGPAAQLARGAAGRTASLAAGEGAGLGRRVAGAFTEGAVSEGIQSAGEAVLAEQGRVDATLQEGIDWGNVARASGEGAIMGGAFGGALGAVSGRAERRAARNDSIAQEARKGDLVEGPIDEAQAAAIGAEQTAAVVAETPTPAPTTGVDSITTTNDGATPTPDRRARRERIAKKGARVSDPIPTPEAAAAPTVAMVDAVQITPEQQAAFEAQMGIAPEAAAATVEAPAAPLAEGVVDAAVETAPVAEAVTPEVVSPTPEAAAPVVEAPLPAAEPVPVEPAVSARPEGPRILPMRNDPNRGAAERQILRNVRNASEEGPRGANMSADQLAARRQTNEIAGVITEQFKPMEAEALGLAMGRTTKDTVQARQITKARAEAMLAAADENGVQLPARFDTSANADAQYSPNVLLLMEARALARKADPKPADFRRFLSREQDIRSGAAETAVAERRTEGDAARRRAPTSEQAEIYLARDEVLEGAADETSLNPEQALMRKQEEAEAPAQEPIVRDRPKVQVDETSYTAGENRAPPKVETRKRRVVSKPEPKPAETPAPAIGQRGRDVLARVKEARERTERNPTEAQKEAGNYAKGTARVAGLEITIETPKGANRTGTDARGRNWSVKMRNDYGYVRGTRGADGDQVDVHLGPQLDEASYVYVIDQNDLQTGAFDEHKAMLGFKDEAAALQAYDSAYSDGRGFERLGGIQKMSVPEFKRWLNSRETRTENTLTEAEKSEARVLEATPDEAKVALREERASPSLYLALSEADVRSRASTTLTASEALGSLDVAGLSALPRALAQHMRKQLTKLVGETNVHVVSPFEMNTLLGRNPEGNSPAGAYYKPDNGPGFIILNENQMGDPRQMAHTVIHEAVHAAVDSRLDTDRQFYARILDLQSFLAEHVQRRPEDAAIAEYALSDPHEFLTEAMSNPDLQEMMGRVQVPADRAERVGGMMNAWDLFVSSIRRMLGWPSNVTTLLEASVRTFERGVAPIRETTGAEKRVARLLERDGVAGVAKALTNRANELMGRPEMAPRAGSEYLLAFRNFDNMARVSDRYFGGRENNPIRKVANALSKQRVRKSQIVGESDALGRDLYSLSQRFRGKVWEDFSSLLNDETTAGVFADRPISQQKHISQKGMTDTWARSQHAELARRYDALPQELKDMRRRMQETYERMQKQAAIELMGNRILALIDVPDRRAMAERIYAGKETKADIAAMGEMYDTIKGAMVLSKIDGPYSPLMRRGNFVVRADLDIKVPKGVKRISDTEFEFTTEEAARAFAESQPMRTTLRNVYVHKTTGETFGVDANGDQVPLTDQDIDAVRRVRAEVQNKHVEFFESEADARAQVLALRREGINALDVEQRQFERGGSVQADMLPSQTQRLTGSLARRARSRNYTDQQVQDLTDAVNEFAVSLLASTRIQTKHLPRQYVQGASKDTANNFRDYVQSMAGYVAKLETQPEIDAAMSDAKRIHGERQGDGMSAARRGIINEVERRATISGNPEKPGALTSAVNRLMTISFIDKLASASYSMVNATQPMMITAPFLAARYGGAKAYAAMGRAYSDVGSLNAIREGWQATISRAKNPNGVTADPVSLIRSRLTNAGERKLLDALVERGALDTDAGLELATLYRQNKGIMGRFDQGIGYLEGISRQMPKSVEAINRSVAALAAYRLEMERSNGDVAKSIDYAHDIVNQTQFNYSQENAPAIFSHPLLRIPLQFKKYGIGMYNLLGEQIALAVRNENPGDRAQAIRSIGYTIGMHMLVAGAMGLPTEPFRMALITANALGVTEYKWEDFERWQREAAADLLGKKMGEVVTRGITRALPEGYNFDLSSRMGLDSLLGAFGEPRSAEANDMKAYLFDLFGGAPASLVLDQWGGMSALMDGDIVKGAEKLIPIKMVSDGIKSYRMMSEGRVSQTGRQTMSEYAVPEAVLRTLGFAPGREAENYERQSAFHRARDVQENKRTEFLREWGETKGAARARLWRDIRAWNRGQRSEVRLSMGDLNAYAKRQRADLRKTEEGIRARRREQHLLRNVNETYGY